MDRRRHRARRPPSWRGERHSRGDDAAARAPSRLGPGRSGVAHAADPSAGQWHMRDLAGTARRASRPFRRGGSAAAGGRPPGQSHAVYGVTHLAALCRLLPERDPHAAIHDALEAILDSIDDPRVAAVGVARFELKLLAELGFGLDLERCAVTGRTDDLVYVSPKSGRAVCAAAGAPWHDRLLRLPAFLHGESAAVEPGTEELAAAFAVTGFFLSRHVLEPRAVKTARRPRQLHRGGDAWAAARGGAREIERRLIQELSSVADVAAGSSGGGVVVVQTSATIRQAGWYLPGRWIWCIAASDEPRMNELSHQSVGSLVIRLWSSRQNRRSPSLQPQQQWGG